MPYCAILECKNDSRRKNISNGGVSYHRFPKDATMKYNWIKATGRINWMPVKTSTICSKHFLEKCFLISKKGNRYLRTTAEPTINIVTLYDLQQNLINTPSGPSKRQAMSTTSESQPVIPENKSLLHIDINNSMPLYECTVSAQEVIGHSSKKYENESDSSAYSTLREQKLKGQLRWSHDKMKRQNSKIKQLQGQNRRLKKKLSNIEEIVNELKETFAMTKENPLCLKYTNIENKVEYIFELLTDVFHKKLSEINEDNDDDGDSNIDDKDEEMEQELEISVHREDDGEDQNKSAEPAIPGTSKQRKSSASTFLSSWRDEASTPEPPDEAIPTSRIKTEPDTDPLACPAHFSILNTPTGEPKTKKRRTMTENAPKKDNATELCTDEIVENIQKDEEHEEVVEVKLEQFDSDETLLDSERYASYGSHRAANTDL